QAEDGIRDDLVTGVQTCALPISAVAPVMRTVLVIYFLAQARFGPRSGRWALRQSAPKRRLNPAHRLRESRSARRAMRGRAPSREIGRASCRERGDGGMRDAGGVI